MKIAIWGAGAFGQYIKTLISQKQLHNIICFIDTKANLEGTKIDRIPIVSPKRFGEEYVSNVDAVLISFMYSIEHLRGFADNLGSIDTIQYGFVRNRVFEAQMDLKDDLLQDRNIIWNTSECLNKPVLRSLETNVVDYCNLNCGGCSHFSNLFKHGEQVPFEVFCSDLQQITKNVYVFQFNMLGGEALLNERIVDYIEFTRQQMPDTAIELVTNGLLIPKQTKQFFECCTRNDITISISGYKPTLLIKDKIKTILEDNNVIYIFRENVDEFGKNIDLLGKIEPETAVKRCRENRCHFFRYGKLYKCPFLALGNTFFQHYNIDIRFNGGIDIYDTELDWSEAIRKLYEDPIDACRYCGIEERIPWHIANQPVIDDWVI